MSPSKKFVPLRPIVVEYHSLNLAQMVSLRFRVSNRTRSATTHPHAVLLSNLAPIRLPFQKIWSDVILCRSRVLVVEAGNCSRSGLRDILCC